MVIALGFSKTIAAKIDLILDRQQQHIKYKMQELHCQSQGG